MVIMILSTRLQSNVTAVVVSLILLVKEESFLEMAVLTRSFVTSAIH